MFTGLIECVGKIKQKGTNFLVVEASFDDVKMGDSIAVNGVCLTVVEISAKTVKFDVMPETFRLTNFVKLGIGAFVNLERAMLANSRFNGHIVQGHVEGTAIFQRIETKDNTKILTFSISQSQGLLQLQNILTKGSIAIDGISLTVVNKINNNFSVSIIPETWKITNLCHKKIGDLVNIETDFLIKAAPEAKSQGANGQGINDANDERLMGLLKDEGFV